MAKTNKKEVGIIEIRRAVADYMYSEGWKNSQR